MDPSITLSLSHTHTHTHTHTHSLQGFADELSLYLPSSKYEDSGLGVTIVGDATHTLNAHHKRLRKERLTQFKRLKQLELWSRQVSVFYPPHSEETEQFSSQVCMSVSMCVCEYV
jgi:hypothetical protein